MKRDIFGRRTVFLFIVLVSAVGLGTTPALAQIPDEFTNLKVLPAGIAQPQLVTVMRGFTTALGVRCNHCHVGEDPDSLEGYDFASDEKEAKRTARVMLKMTAAINAEFLPETGRESVIEVTCLTCHRGVGKPESMSKVMLATIDAEGLDSAIALYRELRTKYFGSAAYDFGPGALDSVTEVLAMQKRDLAAATSINDLNLEFHPDAGYTLFLHARLQLAGGDRDGAIATLERAIEANPEMGWLQGQLDELKNPPPQN